MCHIYIYSQKMEENIQNKLQIYIYHEILVMSEVIRIIYKHSLFAVYFDTNQTEVFIRLYFQVCVL